MLTTLHLVNHRSNIRIPHRLLFVIAALSFFSLALSLLSSNLHAEEFPLAGGDWSHELTGELRRYRTSADGDALNGASFTYLGEYYKSWDNSAFTAKPYIRIDQNDSERSNFDLREFYWDYAGPNWTAAVGFNKVYWGRLEFYNVVDIINQDDLADGQDTKLGQPMINFNWESDEGFLEFYILTGFREARFPGTENRGVLPFPVDDESARIFDDSSVKGLDFGLRWTQTVGDNTEISFSHFNGLARAPDFLFNFDLADPQLIPVYETIDQTGFEAEWISNGWVLKFEAKSVAGQGDRFSVLSAGVEYSFTDLFGSGHDITLITEMIRDGREEATLDFLERDLGLGFRYSLNDEEDSTLLMGFNYDPETTEKLVLFEASRRFGDNWKGFVTGLAVLERPRRAASESALDALTVALNSPLFTNSSAALSDEFKIFLVDLLVSGDIIDLLLDPTPLNNLAFLLEEFSDVNRKLNILEDDDFIQFKLVRYF